MENRGEPHWLLSKVSMNGEGEAKLWKSNYLLINITDGN